MIPTTYTINVLARKMRNGFTYEVTQHNLVPGDRTQSMDKGTRVLESFDGPTMMNNDYHVAKVSARSPIEEAVEVALKTLKAMEYGDEAIITVAVTINPPKAL